MKLNGNSNHGGEHSHHEERVSRVTEVIPGANSAPKTPGAPPPAPPKKMKTWKKVLLIILAAILAALAFVGIHYLIAGHFIWEQPLNVTPKPSAAQTPASTSTPKPTAGPTETDAPVESLPPEDEGEAIVIPADAERKEGVFTFLLAGVDKASNSTDTIMVVSFDTVNHKASITSIPRDTLINIGWATTPKKINAVYPGYINSGGDGMEGLKSQIKNLLGFEVDRYVTVYLNAVEDAVNAIGGVWYDVPREMHYWDPTQDLEIHIYPGYQLLNGADALGYCRFRADYAGGDIERIGVQQHFLKAVATQLISLGNIPHLGELVDVLMKDVDTDLNGGNIAWLARQLLACKPDDIVFQTAPHSGSGINGISFVGLNVEPWLEMINSSINPYKTDVTLANVNILTFNYGGGGLGATNGVIAGGYDSFFCLPCTGATGHSVYHAPGEHLNLEPETPEEAPETGTETAPAEAPEGGETAPETAEAPAEGGEAAPAVPEQTGPEIITVIPGEPAA